MTTRIIVGLGNPGEKYARTRHNAGFLLVDALARAWDARFVDLTPSCLARRTRVDDRDVLLVQPRLFMNRSGTALADLLSRYPVPLENLIVAYDDVALPAGRLRVRPGGSAGGHNGMRNVISALGTMSIARLRIGIGRDQQTDLVDFVLSPWTEEEARRLEKVLEIAAKAARMWLFDRIDDVMAFTNRQDLDSDADESR